MRQRTAWNGEKDRVVITRYLRGESRGSIAAQIGTTPRAVSSRLTSQQVHYNDRVHLRAMRAVMGPDEYDDYFTSYLRRWLDDAAA